MPKKKRNNVPVGELNEKPKDKRLNDYMVLGIKRQEFRGDGKTLKKDHIKAKDSDAAMDKYNDKHREYKAVSLEKLEMG
jgi:hypothetical protein